MLVVLLILCSFFFFCFAVKEHPKLEDKFEEQVQETIKYASTIEDFDELVDPHMLARHCLGLKPSTYVLHALDREERKRELSRHTGSSFPPFPCFNPFLFLVQR